MRDRAAVQVCDEQYSKHDAIRKTFQCMKNNVLSHSGALSHYLSPWSENVSEQVHFVPHSFVLPPKTWVLCYTRRPPKFLLIEVVFYGWPRTKVSVWESQKVVKENLMECSPCYRSQYGVFSNVVDLCLSNVKSQSCDFFYVTWLNVKAKIGRASCRERV